jgi:hypothetical protein
MGETKIVRMPSGIIKDKNDLEGYVFGLQIQFSYEPLLVWLSHSPPAPVSGNHFGISSFQ